MRGAVVKAPVAFAAKMAARRASSHAAVRSAGGWPDGAPPRCATPTRSQSARRLPVAASCSVAGQPLPAAGNAAPSGGLTA